MPALHRHRRGECRERGGPLMLSGIPCDKTVFSEWSAAQRAECAEEPEHERDLSLEREAFSRLCKHWFSAGPHPEEVLQRVFAATADRRPDLLRGLTAREIRLGREESSRGRRWRLQALFPGEDGLRQRYREIVGTLGAAFSGARRPEIPRVTLAEALCVARDGTEPQEASETLSRVLEKIFRGGTDPRAVAQYTFALCGWLFRDLQLNMSLDALGRLFAEERATQSWRSKRFVEGMLREAGFRGCKAGWQKTESACGKFRDAAKDNHNRSKRRQSRRSLSLHLDPATKPKNDP